MLVFIKNAIAKIYKYIFFPLETQFWFVWRYLYFIIEFF